MSLSSFKRAVPVYALGKSDTLNSFAVFRTSLEDLSECVIRLTASSFYRLYVNSRFVSFGPARTAYGYARIDEIDIGKYSNGTKNEILIEVAGYACASISGVKQPSFLCAEVCRREEVLAASGFDFEAFCPEMRVRRVKRYSFQRHFGEVWDFTHGFSLRECEKTETEILSLPLQYLTRTAPYPHYEDIDCRQVKVQGTLAFDESLPYRTDPYSIKPMPKYWGEFEDSEISHFPFVWFQRQRQTPCRRDIDLPVILKEGEYAFLDFGRIECGFIRASLNALQGSDVVIAFSEDNKGNKESKEDIFAFTDMNVQNTLEYILPSSPADIMSFEPYTFRYVCVAVKSGEVVLNSLGVKSYEYDMGDVEIPDCADEAVASVYRGALRTFAHNAVDIYTDCPSRERSGWLCDSYFTAQTEYALFGRVPIEDAFLENYRLYTPDGTLPEGMVPMCYPADTHQNPDGTNRFIPQWAMWYVIEVADYLTERNQSVDRELFRDSIDGLMKFFKKYENRDGLLEKLPSWNFVEWSRANSWTHDVNYPTNFLYSKVLESYYRIYGDEYALRRSREVQNEAVRQSFNGEYFLDHAIRDDKGVLVRQDDCSEACQYYAILFGGFDVHDEKYKELYRLITSVFAAVRREPKPEIMEINAFIGSYLRLEALLKIGERELVLRDVKEFFGEMEKETGTLWEYRTRVGSRDHGFASYALVAIRKALGI